MKREAEEYGENDHGNQATAGGKCGLFLHEFAERRGRLILFFPDGQSSAETRLHFEEFVLAQSR